MGHKQSTTTTSKVVPMKQCSILNVEDQIAQLPFGSDEQRIMYVALKQRWLRFLPDMEKLMLELYLKGKVVITVWTSFYIGSNNRVVNQHFWRDAESFEDCESELKGSIEKIRKSRDPYFNVTYCLQAEYGVFMKDNGELSQFRRGDIGKFTKEQLIAFYQRMLTKSHAKEELSKVISCKDVNGIIVDYLE